MKNIDELTSSLLKTHADLEKDLITPAGANARANVAGKVVAAYKLKLEYHKMHGTLPKIDFLEDSK